MYSGFVVRDDVTADGFTLGKITDFEAGPCETGDAFVSHLAPLLRRLLADLQRALSELNSAAAWVAVQKIKEIQRGEYNQGTSRTAQFYRESPRSESLEQQGKIQSLGLKDSPEE